MPFHHEKLTVYQRALEFASWSQGLIESLTKRTSTRDHLEHAGDSIALISRKGTASSRKRISPAVSKSRTARPWNALHVSISLSRAAGALVVPLQEGNQFWKRS